MNLLATLRELCGAFGPSGFESEAVDAVRRIAAPLADEVHDTVLGGLLIIRRSLQPLGTVVLDAHIDEVGLIVSHIDDMGFMRFSTLGGLDPRVLPAQRVSIRAMDGSRHTGMIGWRPPHVQGGENRQAPQIDELFIDAGCPDRKSVQALGIRVGSPAIVFHPFIEMPGNCVSGKALDDRAGCCLALAALEAAQAMDLPFDLCVSFSTQEEIGGIGAETAMRTVLPTIALVLEGTTATDTPEVAPLRRISAMRHGPAITIADARTLVPERMFRFLENLAVEAGITYQIKTPRSGGTNAGVIQRNGTGVLTGILSVPCRYIHSSAGVLCMQDMEDTLALLVQFMEKAGRLIAKA